MFIHYVYIIVVLLTFLFAVLTCTRLLGEGQLGIPQGQGQPGRGSGWLCHQRGIALISAVITELIFYGQVSVIATYW